MSEKLFAFDPVATTAESSRKPIRRVDRLQGKRVGFLWGMHELSTKFWPVFEEEVVSLYEPREVQKVRKNDMVDGKAHGNTWTPAPLSDIQEMAAKVDYAVLGVGA